MSTMRMEGDVQWKETSCKATKLNSEYLLTYASAAGE